MSYQVEITEKAQAEARSAANWMAQFSEEKATTWFFELSAAIQSLENMPFRCSVAPETKTFGFEIRQLIFGKYRILFNVQDETVYILNVRHSAQKTLSPDEED